MRRGGSLEGGAGIAARGRASLRAAQGKVHVGHEGKGIRGTREEKVHLRHEKVHMRQKRYM